MLSPTCLFSCILLAFIGVIVHYQIHYSVVMQTPYRHIWLMQKQQSLLTRLPPAMRYQDLEIMEEIVNGELIDLSTADVGKFPIYNTVALIKLKYQRLWEEINSGRHYRSK